MNKTDKFRSDMVTENIELKKELKLVSEQLQAVNNGCVELQARWEKLKAEWVNLLKWFMSKEVMHPKTGWLKPIHITDIKKKLQELESGKAGKVEG